MAPHIDGLQQGNPNRNWLGGRGIRAGLAALVASLLTALMPAGVRAAPLQVNGEHVESG